MAAQVVVNNGRQSKPLHDFQQEREVINSLVCNVHFRGHPLSLSANLRFRQFFQRMDSFKAVVKFLLLEAGFIFDAEQLTGKYPLRGFRLVGPADSGPGVRFDL